MYMTNRWLRGGILSALLAFALILHLAPPAPAADLSGSYAWKPAKIGAGGWMRGMMVHPTNSTVRFARGDVDNIYRWDNTNNTWVPMQVSGTLPGNITAAPAAAGAGPIAIDPNNANIVLCGWSFLRSADLQGTNPNVNLNVYRSTDGGRTFSAGNLSLGGDLSSELRGERLVIDPNNSNVVYLGSPQNGLWRSMDGGVTWSNVTANGAPSSTSAALLPRFDKGGGTVSFGGQTVSQRIYVTMDSGPVLQSNDGGNSWTNISSGQDADGKAGFAIVDQNGRLIICNTANGYIDIRTRAGAWSLTQPSYGPVAVCVDPNNANRLFTVGGGGAVARSLDGGSTWTPLGAGMNFSSSQTIQWLRPSSYRPNGHFESCSGIYMDPTGNLWVCGGNDGIMTCTPNDGSDSTSNPPVWSSSSMGIEEMVGQSVTLPPGGNAILMVEDESLFTIFNPDLFTAQHHTLNLWPNNTGLSLGQDVAFCPNQPKFIVETSDNGFYGREPTSTQRYSGYSPDGGITWNYFPSISNGTQPCALYCGLIAVSPRAAGHVNDAPGHDNIVWAGANVVTQNAPAPFYSTDGGLTWTQTHSFDATPGASSGQRCGVSYTYLGFQCGPWTNLLHQHELESDWLIPGTFYFMVTNGGFWKSTDGGATWAQQAGTGLPSATHQGQLRANPNTSGDLWFVDGYEGATSHGLYHTTNSGASWIRSSAFDYAWELALGKASGSYPAIYVYGKMTGDANWGVFRSVDSGVSWDRISYYPTGIIDPPASMAASWDVFGQVYVSFQGDSLVYGQPSGPPPAPAAPTNLTATAGNTQVSLSWFASPNATSYSIYRGTSSGGENGTAIATGIATVNYTDTGLSNGTAYYYKINATNSGGTSANSNEASAVPAPQPPPAPGNVMALAGDAQVTVTWSVASGATSYNVYRGTAAGGEGGTAIATGIASTSYTNTGLTNGTTYYYKVAGVNSTGTGAQSAEASAKPGTANAQIAFASTAPVIDGTVDSIWSSATSYTMPNITGTIPAGATNSGSWQALWDSTNLYLLVSIQDSTVLANNDGVEVYIDGNNGKAASYTSVDWQWVFVNGSSVVQEYSGGNSGSNTTGITKADGALAGGWRMECKIPWTTIGVSPFSSDNIGLDVAYNNFNVAGTRANKLFWFSTTDNDWTNPSLFGTAKLMTGGGSAPAAPTGLIATPSSGQVALTWNSSTGASSYNVKRSTVSGSGYATVSSPTTTSYTNAGLTNGTTYYFVVSAVNSFGESANSAQASATPAGPPAPPTGLTATAGNAQISLAWSASSGATSYNALRSTVSGSGYASVATGIAATTYVNTGLTNGTTYYYVVTATNANGTSGNSGQDSATPIAVPAAPTGLAASSGNTQAALTWNASTGATSYNVSRSTVSGSGYASVATGIATTSYTNTGLTNGTAYYFVVSATNGSGTSGNSAQASATPSAGSTPVIQISSGGVANGTWIADTDYTGGNTSSTASAIDTTAVTNPAPQSVYQHNRWANPGTVSYTIPGLTANATYTVRLHFAETYYTASGQRKFNVTVMGTQVLTNFDIFATAGAANKANIQSFSATANTSGQIVVAVVDGTADHAMVSGVEILSSAIPSMPTGVTATPGNGQVALSWSAATGATSYNVKRSTVSGSGYATVASPATTSYTNTGLANGTTYYYVVSAVNASGESGNSAQASATPTGGGTPVVQINSGGLASGTWVADTDYTGGQASTVTNAIDTTAVTNPAPQAVYQNDRWNSTNGLSYTIPALTPNGAYTVRLHFSENYFTAAGQRKFAVTINGTQVLTEFDIYATAGAAFKANVQQFAATANGSGQITIGLVNGSVNYAKVDGIEILTGSTGIPAAPAGLTATRGNAQVSLSWTMSTGATSYNVKRSTVNGSGYATISSPTTTSYNNTGLTNGTTYYYVVTAVNASGESGNSSQASGMPFVPVQINAGGVLTGAWIADTDFAGGNTSSTATSIDTTAVSNPAPMAVYQTNRWANPGTVTYTIPGLTANSPYTVRLHFAETYFTAAGLRKFNVTVMGSQVLTNFDIFATAGAANKANIQTFTATSNASGQVIVAVVDGAVDHAMISGIEVD